MTEYEKKNAKLLLEKLNSMAKPLSDEASKLVDYAEVCAKKKDNDDNIRHFFYGNREINFQLLSDKVLEFDEDILKIRDEREKWESIRSLRIAGCPYLYDASYLTVISNMAKSLVRYKKSNKEYIIDYANNLIMEENEYKRIFDIKVIEEIPARELTYFNLLIGKELKSPMTLYLSICYGAMKEDIKRHLPSFAPHFYASGVHEYNRKMLALDSENLFLLNHERFDDNDDKHTIYDFTMNGDNEEIIRRTDDSYQYHDYIFYILSDYINKRYESDCKSLRRCHRCVEMGLEMLWYLSNSRDNNTLSLVMGKIPLKGNDSTSHFWVEFKAKEGEKYYALDYTGNIIMESEEYIRLIKAKDVKRIPFKTLAELFSMLADSPILPDTFDVLYFAEDILRDLDRNKFLFK